MKFADLFHEEIQFFEQHIRQYFSTMPREEIQGIQKLQESMEYSALLGGKRFRPVLAHLTAESLGADPKQILPFSLAIELVHTYSLIHDDLPLMDNDDQRRGRPTNHRVYGEAMALLAGDALLTEAFAALAQGYQSQPEHGLGLITLLSRAAGVHGMVGGQAIDILPQAGPREEWEIRYLENLKTGALIQAAVEGPACLFASDLRVRANLGQFGKSLGLAFQIADDLQDHDPSAKVESTSFVQALGFDKTKELLGEVSDQAEAALSASQVQGSRLFEMIKFNLARAEA